MWTLSNLTEGDSHSCERQSSSFTCFVSWRRAVRVSDTKVLPVLITRVSREKFQKWLPEILKIDPKAALNLKRLPPKKFFEVDTNPGVNVCWVCAAGLSEPLPHYSLFFFFGQL